MFDRIFTTDESVVEAYERRCGRRDGSVGVLSFAAQPELHHPVGAHWEDVVCFAGSYGEIEWEERRRDIEQLLDGASSFDLRILDRNAAAQHRDRAFPERFRPFIAGAVSYSALVELQRRYKVFLNVNTVRSSRGMFSRRVYELLACGASVVSSPSVGVSELFGDIVDVVRSAAETRRAINRLLGDEDRRLDLAARGISRVHLEHTYRHRMRVVLDAVGKGSVGNANADFALLTSIDSGEDVERIVSMVHSQDHRPRRVLVIGEDQGSLSRARTLLGDQIEVEAIRLQPGEDQLGASRRAADRIEEPFVACFSPRHGSGPSLLGSLLACTSFVDADVIGKVARSCGRARVVHAWCDRVHPHAILITRPALAIHGWSSKAADLDRLADAYRDLRTYASDDLDFTPSIPRLVP